MDVFNSVWWQDRSIEDIRNIAIILGGIIGLLVAIKRSSAASRQARTGEDGLMVDRYIKAVELLAADNVTKRTGGIYALEDIAKSRFKSHYPVVLATLCSFIRDRNAAYSVRKKRTRKRESIIKLNSEFRDLTEGIAAFQRARRDYRYVVGHLLGKRALTLARRYLHKPNYEFIDMTVSRYDLSNVDFNHFNCRERVFTHCLLDYCNFSKKNLTFSDFSDSRMYYTNFKDADLSNVTFEASRIRRADFTGANLKNSDFKDVVFGEIGDNVSDFKFFGKVTLSQMKEAKNVDPQFIDFLREYEADESRPI